MLESKVTVESQEVTLTVYSVKCDSCSFHRTVADFTTAHDLRYDHEQDHRERETKDKT